MSDQFIRQSNADLQKRLDTELLQVQGLEVHRQRVIVAPSAFTYRVEDSGAELLVGVAVAETADAVENWSIKRVLMTSAGPQVSWPNGSPDFKFAWTLRATYTFI